MWPSSCASPLFCLFRPSFGVARASCPHRQGIHDRAAVHRALTGTGRDQGFERRVDFPKLRDLATDLLLFPHRLLLNRRTVGVWIGAERQQLLYLVQREPDLLRILDEPDAGDLIARIDTVALAFRWAFDQSLPLVEAHCLN